MLKLNINSIFYFITCLLGLLYWTVNTQALNTFERTQQGDDFQFFIGDWEDVVEMASKRQVPILVYLFEDSTIEYDLLEKMTFNHPVVKRLFTDKFISCKLNKESLQAIKFRDIYQIYELPTLLFFDKKGSFLEKVAGLPTTNDLCAIGNKIAPITPFYYKVPRDYMSFINTKKQYEKGERNPQFLLEYATELKKFNEPYFIVVKEYIDSWKEEEFKQKKNVHFIMHFSQNIGSPAFYQLLTNKHFYASIEGVHRVNTQLKEAIRRAIIDAAHHKDDLLFNEALETIDKSHLPDGAAFKIRMTALHYQYLGSEKDIDTLYTNYVLENMERHKLTEPKILNEFALQFAYKTENQEELKLALAWSYDAMGIEPYNFEYLYTHAALQYCVGKQNNALRTLMIAKKVGEHDPVKNEEVVKLREAIQGGRPLPK